MLSLILAFATVIGLLVAMSAWDHLNSVITAAMASRRVKGRR